jgi:hypothetical protein
MSDETKHPERRAGQVYKDRFGFQYVLTGEQDGRWMSRIVGMSVACPIEAMHWENLALVADAPATPQPSAPVVDRAACEAWCGMVYGTQTVPLSAFLNPDDPIGKWKRGGYCSKQCADNRHPPLAAQPAEAKACYRCLVGYGQHTPPCVRAQPAEQPKPAAKVECRVRFSVSGCFGEVLDRVLTKAGVAVPCCETCMVAQDGQFARSKIHTTGKPYTGPERLPRPRLAHSMGIEDPTLPEAR